MPKGITIGECQERRRQIIDAFKEEVEANRDFLDDLFGWTPTVEDLLKNRCCKGEKNGCDCEQLLQYYSDQSDVIEKLEAYLAAGNFSTFPKATILATGGPMGIRTPGLSCCLNKLVETMEAWITDWDGVPVPSATLLGHFYQGWIITKSTLKGDPSEFNRSRAEVELGRSRAFRKLIFDTYALCCCGERTFQD